jgi:hypothetical protein
LERALGRSALAVKEAAAMATALEPRTAASLHATEQHGSARWRAAADQPPSVRSGDRFPRQDDG